MSTWASLRLFLKKKRRLAFALVIFSFILLLRVMFHRGQNEKVLHTAVDRDQDIIKDFEQSERFESFESAVLHENSLTGSPKCLLLQLDPFHSGVAQFMKDMGKLRCDKPYYSKLRHMQLLVEGKGITETSYRPILPPKDGGTSAGFELGEAKTLISNTQKLDRGKEGNIQHAGGKCIHPLGGYSDPPEGTKLCLYNECGEKERKLIFQMADDGIIKHKFSGKCIAPNSLTRAEAREQTDLIFTEKCDEWASFKAIDNGMVQHMKSKMCIHYQASEVDPPNNVILVLYPDCHSKHKHRYHWYNQNSVNKHLSVRKDVREEFLEITLQSSRTAIGEVDKEYVMQISPNFDLKEPPESEKRLNFLMLMLHSTSLAHFMRKMPMSFNFLENRIDSIFFRGYSVVDESTRGQLAALLAGSSPKDFADKSIDSFPWLFKIAKDHGYVTMVTEDKPFSPMFRDTLSGFKTKPAHHHTSPFWSAATRMKQSSLSSFCLGGQPRHNVTLAYLRDYFSIYKRLPKFALAMLSDISSWNPNALSYADDDVFSFLNWMKEEGHLERTVLVLFSDRGSKQPYLRRLLEGKMEERMPLLTVTIPSKAPKAIVDSIDNLKANSKLLTHPFEVYETMKSLILHHVNGEAEISKREPRNLLARVDTESRSCESLKVPAHWCPCVKAYLLPTKNADKFFEDAGKKVVSHVNRIFSNSELRSICSELSYHDVKIDKTVELKPNQEVLKFRRSESAGQCVDCKPIFERHSTTRKESFFVIYIEVNPGLHLLRAVVNIGKKDIFIHPHLVFVNERKESKCISNNSKLNNLPLQRLCVCR